MPEDRADGPARPPMTARPGGFGRPGPGGGRGGPRGGIAAMAYAEKPKDVGGAFNRILTYLGRQKSGLIVVLLLVAFSTGLEAAGALPDPDRHRQLHHPEKTGRPGSDRPGAAADLLY